MKKHILIKVFAREEDGSLLVFFAVSIIAILGVFALSFDMGRRASTQTDMQSFADNVALAAAGELDGTVNAIANARDAATSVIIAANERLKAGTGVAPAGLTITFDPTTDLVFYTSLPGHDRPGTFDPALLGDSTNTNYKYNLPTTNVTTNPTLARFVGVTLDTRDVDWLFAEVVTNNAPDAAVGAIAIAGNSGYTCEISPYMFCLPMEADGVTPKTLVEGQAVQLRTVGRNAQWNPGEFGFLNIDWLIANDSNAAAGPCASLNPESRRQACLIARGLNACFSSRGVDIQPGQRQGQEGAAFNLPWGIFEAVFNQFRNDPVYAVGPHIVSGRDISNNCRDTGASPDTMAFPLDDCHYSSNCADGRFGDGNWTTGRNTYVDTNYTFTKPNGTVVNGSFFDFPETGLTRYEYYLREIERAANGGVMTAAGNPPYTGSVYVNDPVRGPVNNYDSWDDYWDDNPSGNNPIIPDAQSRSENGLPQCNITEGAGPDRRIAIVAGIDCVNQTLTGNEPNVPVVQYYRTFMLGPMTQVSGNANQGQMFDMWVEIIEPVGGEGGASTTQNTAFREVVQLYR